MSRPSDDVLLATLPGRLFHHAQVRGERVAIREKNRGIWNEYTWADYLANVRRAARAMWTLGVRPGDSVSILSDNRPEWLYADLAAQSIGARSVGIYQTNPAADVEYILADSASKVLICEDQEQLDKALEVLGGTGTGGDPYRGSENPVPSLQHVVVIDPRGTRDVDEAKLLTWEQFLDRGDDKLDDDWFEERLSSLVPEDPSMIVYTSGTTGPPKGAMISSKNVVGIAVAFNESMGLGEDDFVLSYLPLCHVAEKILSVFFPMTTGGVVHFGESIETVQADLREVSPTLFLGVPRIWEKIHSSVTVKMKNASWLKRTLYNTFTRAGLKIAEGRRKGGISAWQRFVWFVGDLTVYRPLQERLGLRRCKIPVTGAAPISPELINWFHSIGVPVSEGYGMTECAGVSHMNPPDAMRIGSVGKTLPGVECRLADDGEILLRGSVVFCGYLNRPDATAETIDADGWLHTGDVGQEDNEGYLRITGRKKEIIITSGGKNISPEKIENKLKVSPYIKEAIAIGDARKFVSALIQIEYDTVGDWAMRQKITYTSYADLASKPEVRDLIKGEVNKANDALAQVESVRSFKLLPKELSQDDGELTATQKVRRRNVHAAFEQLIESMYTKGAAA